MIKLAFLTMLITLSFGLTINKEQINPCATCDYVVDFVFTEVTQYNKTIHDIAELTKDLCDEIGGPVVKQECDFILNNLENIMDWIQKGFTPDQVCEELGFCSKEFDWWSKFLYYYSFM